MNSSVPPVELATPITIEDELEAMRREIEGASPAGTEVDHVDAFIQMLKNYSPKISDYVMKMINDTMQPGGTPLSLDSIRVLPITESEATQLYLAAQDYITELNKAVADSDTLSADAVSTEPYQKPEVEVTGIQEPDTPVINNTDPTTSLTVPVPLAYHQGMKIVDAAYTGATLTQAYNEGTKKDAKGNTIYFKTTKVDGLDPSKAKILDKSQLLPGTTLKFVVDLEYDGPANIDDSLSWDSNQEVESKQESGENYVGKDGKVKSGLGKRTFPGCYQLPERGRDYRYRRREGR